jgi:putative DNA primase/helicase
MWKTKPTQDGRTTKVPIGVNGRAISITNQKCFRTFDEAQTLYTKNKDLFDGIGFVFTEDDNFLGIDLDSVNKWNGWKEIVKRFDSYTEISPSKRGLHIITEGFLPNLQGERTHGIKRGSHETGGIEAYDALRYLTVTIDPLDDFTEIKPNQSAINWLTSGLDDRGITNKILNTDYGEKFIKLWNGSTTQYTSSSEADLAFCRILANNHCPIHQIDRLFRKSKLYRQKWDERRGNKTYGQMTLEKATTE